MSDTGNSSPRDVTDGGLTAELQRSIRNRVNSQHAKFRHRATPAKVIKPIYYSIESHKCANSFMLMYVDLGPSPDFLFPFVFVCVII